MKNFLLGVLVTAAIAAAAYYISTIDAQAAALLVLNNAIGALYNLEAIILAS